MSIDIITIIYICGGASVNLSGYMMYFQKIERLKGELHLLDAESKPKNKHTFFVDSKKEGKYKRLVDLINLVSAWKCVSAVHKNYPFPLVLSVLRLPEKLFLFSLSAVI